MIKKMNVLNLVILAGLVAMSSAQASIDLTGKVMNCTVKPTDDATTHNTYQFIKGPTGKDLAIYFQNDLASTPEAFSYTVVNGKLTIEFDNDALVYDISKPSDIERSFKACVFPGEPDGDSQASCSTTTESCVLN